MDKIFTTDQLKDFCKSFGWKRTITQLHVHHTYKPDHSDYNGQNGLQLQQNMRNYHVNTNKWQDIAQHLTLLPDGQWVTGRDFNLDPASITGWNTGAFCIEMVGNFDTGRDKFTGAQAESMFKFCACFCELKVLNVERDVKFHRDSPTAGKTCPGTGIDRAWFMAELKKVIQGHDQHWGQPYFDYLQVKGYDIKETRFNDYVTRAELFKLLAIAEGKDV